MGHHLMQHPPRDVQGGNHRIPASLSHSSSKTDRNLRAAAGEDTVRNQLAPEPRRLRVRQTFTEPAPEQKIQHEQEVIPPM